MESLIWCLPAGSVSLRGWGSEKEQWPLPALLSGKKLPPSSCLGAIKFSSSPYASGAFSAAASVLELRGSESGNCQGFQKFLP